MEASPADFFSDPEIEELSFIHQWELSSLDNEFTSQGICECLQETLSSESSCFESLKSPTSVEGHENFPVAPKSWNSSCPSPGILSFGNPSSPGGQAQSYIRSDGGLMATEVVQMEVVAANGLKRAKAARSRPIALNQEHVIAERKRREKITEMMIALSAIIPNLKKRDKASILTDAIEYMKQMEQKVKTLEDQLTAKETVESAVLIKMPQVLSDASSDQDRDGLPSDRTLPEVEARQSGKTVLIKIHCQEHKGVLVKALTEIENLHLSVVDTSSIPFSDGFLDITVTAQVGEGFSMTVEDLLNELKSAFSKFIVCTRWVAYDPGPYGATVDQGQRIGPEASVDALYRS